MKLRDLGIAIAIASLSAAGCGGGSNDTNGQGGAGGAGSSANTTSASNGGTTTSGGMTGAGGSGTGAGTGGASCLAEGLLSSLGKDHLIVGASMEDDTAKLAPFELRYLYLAGGLFDGTDVCSSCKSGCTTNGSSCANTGPGCAWWGCWQWDEQPPGQYIRDFLAKVKADGQIPMVTYYEILQASGVPEGEAEVKQAAADKALMTRFFADVRFLLKQIDKDVAFVHIEPDFWGYAEQAGQDPHATKAAVASANPTDCGAQEDSIAGLGRCLIAMSRKYAPNAKIGLHGSSWGTGYDVTGNKDPSLDVVGEANKLGQFLSDCGAGESDFIAVDASDRDSGYYESIGQDRWWDDTNKSLPSFHQAFDWARALAVKVGKPILWWQVPVGNMSQPGGDQHWKDNRVDYFFGHMDELAGAASLGVAYGAGQGDQTTPETDGGNLVSKVGAYGKSGGQPPVCP